MLGIFQLLYPLLLFFYSHFFSFTAALSAFYLKLLKAKGKAYIFFSDLFYYSVWDLTYRRGALL